MNNLLTVKPSLYIDVTTSNSAHFLMNGKKSARQMTSLHRVINMHNHEAFKQFMCDTNKHHFPLSKLHLTVDYAVTNAKFLHQLCRFLYNSQHITQLTLRLETLFDVDASFVSTLANVLQKKADLTRLCLQFSS